MSDLMRAVRIASLYKKADEWTCPALRVRSKGRYGYQEATLYLDFIFPLHEVQIVGVEGKGKNLPSKGGSLEDVFRWIKSGWGSRELYLPHKGAYQARLDQNDRTFIRSHVWGPLSGWTGSL